MEPLANVPRLSTARAREFFGKLQPHAVFLALTLTFGVAVMLLNPPFQAPDEGDHFYRAFQISEGGFVGQKGFGNAGGPLPVIAFRVADPEGISFHPDVKMTPAIWRESGYGAATGNHGRSPLLSSTATAAQMRDAPLRQPSSLSQAIR